MPKRVRNTRNIQRKRYYTKHRKNAVNSRKYWIPEDENEVLLHKISDVELSQKIGRSVQAIQIKRNKLLYG